MDIIKHHNYLIEDVNRRLFIENQSRIHRCLDLITEEQLWYKHNPNVNSIGNLILHLCGNVTQYICAGLFQEKDDRERDLEFSQSGTYNIQEIREILDKTMDMIKDRIGKVTPIMLTEKFGVQGFDENGTSILVHVTEHYSYHVGQITYLTKFLNNVDTGYYAGKDLNKKST